MKKTFLILLGIVFLSDVSYAFFTGIGAAQTSKIVTTKARNSGFFHVVTTTIPGNVGVTRHGITLRTWCSMSGTYHASTGKVYFAPAKMPAAGGHILADSVVSDNHYSFEPAAGFPLVIKYDEDTGVFYANAPDDEVSLNYKGIGWTKYKVEEFGYCRTNYYRNSSFPITIYDGNLWHATTTFTILVDETEKIDPEDPVPLPPLPVLEVPTQSCPLGNVYSSDQYPYPPPALEGEPYSIALLVAGGKHPYTFSLDPAFTNNLDTFNLEFDSTYGLIRSKANTTIPLQTAGEYIVFRVIVHDSMGNIDTNFTQDKRPSYKIRIVSDISQTE